MENKQIQEQRKRGYFIQATKEILKSEGLTCASVRNIASQAGYSFATLYNYFKDVNELVFLCVKDFQDECESFVKSETTNYSVGIERIKQISISYMKFFTQYPGIYDLFYVEKMARVKSQEQTSTQIYSFLNNLCIEDWNYCVENLIFTPDEVELLKYQLTYVVSGILLFYMNRLIPESYTEFIDMSDKQLNFIFNRK